MRDGRRQGGANVRLSSELISVCSETGVRPHNEDRCDFRIAADQSAGLLILADGMGGQAAGEVASHLAVETLLEAFDQCGFGRAEGLLEEAFQAAHARIQREAARDAARDGMGTTLVAVVLQHGQLLVGHVGDSRAFQFRPPYVRRLTEDHLYISEVLGLEEKEARHHPKGHVLAQAVGIPGKIRPSFHRFEAEPGDWIVLCSDGVHASLAEPEMGRLLTACPLSEAVAEMVNAALVNGSRDNCSIVAAALPRF
jgi:protein phosphatase